MPFEMMPMLPLTPPRALAFENEQEARARCRLAFLGRLTLLDVRWSDELPVATDTCSDLNITPMSCESAYELTVEFAEEKEKEEEETPVYVLFARQLQIADAEEEEADTETKEDDRTPCTTKVARRRWRDASPSEKRNGEDAENDFFAVPQIKRVCMPDFLG